MSDKQMVSVPREPTREMLAAAREVNGIFPTWRAMVDAAPTEQHQGDPVALPARKPWNGLLPTADNLKGEGYNACIDEIAKLGPLYTRPAQGEPVAWLVYRGMECVGVYRKDPIYWAHGYRLVPLYTHADPACTHEWTDDGEFNLTCTKCGAQENHEPHGWVQTRGNAINHFTQEWDVVEEWEAQGFEYKAMFDHADPAEVERLRDENRRLHEAGEFLDGVNQGIEDKLRAQLAERDALLREIHDGTLSGYARYSKIEAVLSASAEPSAAVELDERAEFERTFPDLDHNLCSHEDWQAQYERPKAGDMWNGWQARAALERKP